MKKLLALLLAAVMCLSLVACGGPETSGNEPLTNESVSQPETDPTPDADASDNAPTEEPPVEEDTPDDEVCCVLTVSINPEFNLHLNKNGLVLTLECLNEDAQNALASADVVGMAVEDAIAALLEEIYQYDSTVFPEEQPVIKVTVDMLESSGPLNEAILRMDEAVWSFAENHQIPIAYQRGSAPASDEMTSTVVSDSTDENGNRVVVEVDDDGTEWQTISSGETGQVLELIRTDPDGTVTHCDMETNTTIITRPDGTTEQTEGVIGKG